MFKQLENGQIEVVQDCVCLVVDLCHILSTKIYDELTSFTGIVNIPGYGDIVGLQSYGDGFVECNEFGIFLDSGVISVIPIEIATKLSHEPDLGVEINLCAGDILQSNNMIAEIGELIFSPIENEDEDEDEDEF